MFKPVPVYVGWRYIGAKRQNHFISFISMTSVLGLTLGVAVLIVVLSIMNGFDRELQKRILGMVPHGSIHAEQPIKNWRELVQQIEARQDVLAAAPYTQMQAMLSNSGNVTGALVTGVDPEYETRVSLLQDFMVEGELDNLQAKAFTIILGRGLALQLGVTVGDRITLVLPEAMVTPAGLLPRYKRFTVSGIFEVGAELDGTLAIIHLADAARLLRQPQSAQAVRIKLEDLFAAPSITPSVAGALGAAYTAKDWTYTHGNLFNAIKMEKAMIGLLLMLIVAVAVFNIVASLVMLVREKRSDIAILLTLGATPAAIRAIFIVQGAMIGFVGTAVGGVIGVVVALNISQFVNWVDASLGLDLFSFYFVSYLPSHLSQFHVVLVTSIAFAMSVLATIYPASKAAKIQAAEALRYE